MLRGALNGMAVGAALGLTVFCCLYFIFTVLFTGVAYAVVYLMLFPVVGGLLGFLGGLIVGRAGLERYARWLAPAGTMPLAGLYAVNADIAGGLVVLSTMFVLSIAGGLAFEALSRSDGEIARTPS